LIVVIAGAGGGDEPETSPSDLGVPTTSDSLGDRSEDEGAEPSTTEGQETEADVETGAQPGAGAGGVQAAPVTPTDPPTVTPGTPVTPGTEQLAPPVQDDGGGAVEPAPAPQPAPEPAPPQGEGGGAVAPSGDGN
jgi:hypothetical protein